MLGMGGDGDGAKEKELRKVTDKARAERGRSLQTQVKSQRRVVTQEISR